MVEWVDDAIVLSAEPWGETGAIVALLTVGHGRYAGLLPGGQSRRFRALLQPGNHVRGRWRARLEEHLGHLALEPLAMSAAAWLDHPEILALLRSACVVTEACLPERQPMPGIYAGLSALLALEDPAHWAPAYVRWEVELLRALGYGLNLDRCALTGRSDDLSHVSPRTGCAVTRAAATPWLEKLLALPPFLAGGGYEGRADILAGLRLTGHFLARHVFVNPHSRKLVPRAGELPSARLYLETFYQEEGGDSASVTVCA